jgi:alanine dehydrogenase
MLKAKRADAVIVDVAVDRRGGCFETSHPTTHADPTYEVDGIIHYCVANVPGAGPVTSSEALNNATVPFGLALANRGFAAVMESPHLRAGLKAVADSLGLAFPPVDDAIVV